MLLFKENQLPKLQIEILMKSTCSFSQKLLLVDVPCAVALLCSDTVNMSGYLQRVELVHRDTQGNRSKQ